MGETRIASVWLIVNLTTRTPRLVEIRSRSRLDLVPPPSPAVIASGCPVSYRTPLINSSRTSLNITNPASVITRTNTTSSQQNSRDSPNISANSSPTTPTSLLSSSLSVYLTRLQRSCADKFVPSRPKPPTLTLRQQLAQLQVPPPPSTTPDSQALTSLRLDTLTFLTSTALPLPPYIPFRTNIPISSPSPTSLTQNVDREKDARRKQDAQADLFQREISFKDLIVSYQAEETMLLKLFNDYKSLSTSHPQYQSLLDLIDQLEQQLFDL